MLTGGQLPQENSKVTLPLSLGDIDGDGKPELVTVGNDRLISVVDPISGEVPSPCQRDVAIRTRTYGYFCIPYKTSESSTVSSSVNTEVCRPKPPSAVSPEQRYHQA